MTMNERMNGWPLTSALAWIFEVQIELCFDRPPFWAELFGCWIPFIWSENYDNVRVYKQKPDHMATEVTVKGGRLPCNNIFITNTLFVII